MPPTSAGPRPDRGFRVLSVSLRVAVPAPGSPPAPPADLLPSERPPLLDPPAASSFAFLFPGSRAAPAACGSSELPLCSPPLPPSRTGLSLWALRVLSPSVAPCRALDAGCGLGCLYPSLPCFWPGLSRDLGSSLPDLSLTGVRLWAPALPSSPCPGDPRSLVRPPLRLSSGDPWPGPAPRARRYRRSWKLLSSARGAL